MTIEFLSEDELRPYWKARKCCGEQMTRIPREDQPGVFWICDLCFTIHCPEDSPRVTEIGR